MVIVDPSRTIIKYGKSKHSNLKDSSETVDNQWYSQNFSYENYKVFNYNFHPFETVLKGISHLTSTSLEKIKNQTEPILERLRSKRVCQKCSNTLPVFRCQSVQTLDPDYLIMSRFEDQYVNRINANSGRIAPIREYSNTEWMDRVRRRNEASRMNQEFSRQAHARIVNEPEYRTIPYERNNRPAKMFANYDVQSYPGSAYSPNNARYLPPDRQYPRDWRYGECTCPYAPHQHHTNDCSCCECDGCSGCRRRNYCCKYGRRRRKSWPNRAYCYIRRRINSFRKSDVAQQTYPYESQMHNEPMSEDDRQFPIISGKLPSFMPEEYYPSEYNTEEDEDCCCCCCCCSDNKDPKKCCNSTFAQTVQNANDMKTNGTQTEKCKCRCRCCKKRKQQLFQQSRIPNNYSAKSQMGEKTKIYKSSSTQHEHGCPKEQMYNVLYGQVNPSPLFLDPIFSSPLTGKKYNIVPKVLQNDYQTKQKCTNCKQLSNYLDDLKPTKIPTNTKEFSAMFDTLEKSVTDNSQSTHTSGTFHKNPFTLNLLDEVPSTSESESLLTTTKSVTKSACWKGKCSKKTVPIDETTVEPTSVSVTENENKTNDKIFSNIGNILGKYTLEDLEKMLDNASKSPCNCKYNTNGGLVEAAQIVNNLMDESVQFPTANSSKHSDASPISESSIEESYATKNKDKIQPQPNHCFDKVSSISSGYVSGSSSGIKDSSFTASPNYKPILDNIKEEDEKKSKCGCRMKNFDNVNLLDFLPVIPLIPQSIDQEKFEDLSNIIEEDNTEEVENNVAEDAKTEETLDESIAEPDMPSQIESLPKLPSQTTDNSLTLKSTPEDDVKLPVIRTRTGLNFLGKKGYVKLKQVFRYKSRVDLNKNSSNMSMDCKCSNDSILEDNSKSQNLEKYNNVKDNQQNKHKKKKKESNQCVLAKQDYDSSDSQSLD